MGWLTLPRGFVLFEPHHFTKILFIIILIIIININFWHRRSLILFVKRKRGDVQRLRSLFAFSDGSNWLGAKQCLTEKVRPRACQCSVSISCMPTWDFFTESCLTLDCLRNDIYFNHEVYSWCLHVHVTSIPDNAHPKTKHGCKHPCEVWTHWFRSWWSLMFPDRLASKTRSRNGVHSPRGSWRSSCSLSCWTMTSWIKNSGYLASNDSLLLLIGKEMT